MITWKNKKFYKDGEEFQIHGGSIHYFRSMPDKWYDLLLKLKNCGLNTVETYCAWNLHEPYPGQIDFSGHLDIERFIQTATELGLYVIIRPGPYICAEYEFGGLPGWLLKNESMRCRTDEGPYLDYVKRYFKELMKHILPYLDTNGGNVIMMAAENEYGSFGNNTRYMNKCLELLKDLGVDVPIFTSDGHTKMFLDGGHADECFCALDFGYDEGVLTDEHFEEIRKRQPDAPILHVEFWIGMFTHWGQPAMTYKPEFVEAEVRRHLEQDINFVLYMFHGGTNFGFTNGANYFNRDNDNLSKYSYLPDTTSYDYDAPLNEWGEITDKYLAIQKVMSEYLGKELPVAEPIPLMELGDVALTEAAPLLDNLDAIGTMHTSAYIHHMEYYEQSVGFILYRTRVQDLAQADVMFINGIADMAHVFFNGEYKGSIYRNDEKPYLDVNEWLKGDGVLDILVENMGHINFGYKLGRDRKGILENVMIHHALGPFQTLCNWETYTLPMGSLEGLEFSADTNIAGPGFYKGTFKAKEQKDCFVHLESFNKGFVFVNGFNLGRYWNVGPQLSLYLPASILKEENEIIVFDAYAVENPVVSIRDYHILRSMTTDEGPATIM